jgi:hypothetical protein
LLSGLAGLGLCLGPLYTILLSPHPLSILPSRTLLHS